MSRKSFLIIFSIALLAFASLSCGGEEPQPAQQKLRISASFYPLAEFARQVGGEQVEVAVVVPTGSAVHSYRPAPEDIASIGQSRLFIYSGAGMEPWVEPILAGLKETTVVKASEGIALSSVPAESAATGGPHNDPHYYLDPASAQQLVLNLARKLGALDPENSSYYTQNAAAYAQQLANLDREYRNGLIDCGTRQLVTSHAAFAYLARRYNLTQQLPIAGIWGGDAAPARLTIAAQFVKDNGLGFTFVEKLNGPGPAATVAGQAGVKTLVLDPIEGLTAADAEAGKDFIALMQENLASLREGLRCK